jgi:hypothetical protein
MSASHGVAWPAATSAAWSGWDWIYRPWRGGFLRNGSRASSVTRGDLRQRHCKLDHAGVNRGAWRSALDLHEDDMLQ